VFSAPELKEFRYFVLGFLVYSNRQLYCRTQEWAAVQLPPQHWQLISQAKLNK
jgi:hypothetical protein